MAKKLLGPWSVLYPVRFYSGGDTTTQAFGKHIQEIARIYGLLNALDAGKAGSDEIAEAMGNITHNGLKGLQGGSQNERYHLTAAQVGKLDGAASAADVIKVHNNLQGLQGGSASERYHLTATQIAKLEGAAGAGDVITNHNSLQGLQGGSATERYHLTAKQASDVQNLINNPPGPVVAESLADNGYVKFRNGLILQWGRTANFAAASYSNETMDVRQSFPIAFPSQCFVVVLGTYMNGGDRYNFYNMMVRGYSTSHFIYDPRELYKANTNWTLLRGEYVALGK